MLLLGEETARRREPSGSWKILSRMGQYSGGVRVLTSQTVASPHKVTKRLYTIGEAAIFLGRNKWSVRRLIWVGELPAVRVGRRVHLDVHDMEAFIEKHKEVAD